MFPKLIKSVSLRRLLGQGRQESFSPIQTESADGPEVAEERKLPDGPESSQQLKIPGEALPHSAAETTEGAETPDTEQEGDEVTAAIEDLSQEIRKVGRELFRSNRASERNQELLAATLEELGRLNTTLTLLPDEAAEQVFQAKASMCQDIFRVLDSVEAGLQAAEDVLKQLEENANIPIDGLVSLFDIFARARFLRDSLVESVSAMRKWKQGQELLHDRLLSVLRSAGVSVIETLGRAFNPNLHRAVSVEYRTDVQPGTIVGEEMKGYELNGRVLRFAEVIVARHE